MTKEYRVTVADGYDFLIVSPAMVAYLIKKAKNTKETEFVIPAEVLLPQGYVQYIGCVLAAGMESCDTNPGVQRVYQLAADQIKRLSVNLHPCFQTANVYKQQSAVQFHIRTSTYFKQLLKRGRFIYVF